MVKPKKTIDKKEPMVEEDWCPFHVLVTIIFVSWYNSWTTIWTRYLEGVAKRHPQLAGKILSRSILQ